MISHCLDYEVYWKDVLNIHACSTKFSAEEISVSPPGPQEPKRSSILPNAVLSKILSLHTGQRYKQSKPYMDSAQLNGPQLQLEQALVESSALHLFSTVSKGINTTYIQSGRLRYISNLCAKIAWCLFLYLHATLQKVVFLQICSTQFEGQQVVLPQMLSRCPGLHKERTFWIGINTTQIQN